MGRKTPPFPEHPAWTEARFWAFVRSALRKAWSRWPPKYQVLADAKRTVEGKRHKYEYQCSECKQWFKQTEVQVDHIIPTGSLKAYEDLPEFVSKLFVSKDKLSLMCKPCHQRKTNDERKDRAKGDSDADE
jgi:5-methylcytosine-specific restriction endonuclease McrA